MRVLFISENRCRDNLIPFPLGIASVASSTRAAGHEISCLDLMFSEDPAGEVASAVREFRPDCVGLSIRNIDNQDMYSLEFFVPPVKELAASARRESGAPVVLGGAGFTIFPVECLSFLDLELGVVGEGEVSFPLLLECLETGSDPRGAPGVAWRRGGSSGVNPPSGPADLDALPAPERGAFDVGKYNRVPGSGPPFTANLQARRGCHMRCIYCSTPAVEGRSVRMRDPSSVAGELESLEEAGIRNVMFTDSLFNFPTDYTRRLCREIASRGLSLTWSAIYNPAFNDPGLFGLMREAGCRRLSVGNESGSMDMLAALRKDFSREDILQSVRGAHSAGLDVFCFLMLGGPGETRGSVEESVELMDELEPEAVQVTVGIRIFPGCELHDIALREGVVAPGQDLLQPAFYLAPDVEPWLYGHMREVCAERRGWSL